MRHRRARRGPRPAAARRRSAPRAWPRSWPGLGFYAYLLTNILWLQYVWGYDVLRAGLALVPGALVAAVVAARLGPLAERHRLPRLVVPGALVWAGAYLWYHQRWASSRPSCRSGCRASFCPGIGVGATLPLLGSAALAAVPGGRYATASAAGLQRAPARRRAGHLDPGPRRGQPDRTRGRGRPPGRWLLSIVAFVMVALLAPADRQGRRPGRMRRTSTTAAPLILLPDARHLAPEPMPRRPPRSGSATSPSSPPCRTPARVILAAASRRSACRRRGAGSSARATPRRSVYLLRSGRLEVVQGDQVLRTLTPGAVVGELALLTGEPRSAGIRARRDASLIEMPREAFDGLLAATPRRPAPC